MLKEKKAHLRLMCVAQKRRSLNPLELACVQTPLPPLRFLLRGGGGSVHRLPKILVLGPHLLTVIGV